MPTRNDVAQLAGVSSAVVSYVLNNSNYVSAEKREAVLKAARELGYQPNFTAQSLKKHGLQQLLFLVDDIRSEILSDISYYMENYAFERGYFLSVASCTLEKAMNYSKVFQSGQYAGVFIGSNVYTAEEMNHLASKGVVMALYQTRIYENLDPRITIIGCDMMRGAESLVDYLIQKKGHRNIGYISGFGNPTTPAETGPFGDGFRINGFINALRRHGIPVRDDMFYIVNYNQAKQVPAEIGPNGEKLLQFIELTRESVAALMSAPQERRITAFIASTDRNAAELIIMLNSLGYSVPEDMLVTGMGNTSSSTICQPGITTLDILKEEIARHAVDVLIRKINGEQPENKLFPMQLILRRSTGDNGS